PPRSGADGDRRALGALHGHRPRAPVRDHLDDTVGALDDVGMVRGDHVVARLADHGHRARPGGDPHVWRTRPGHRFRRHRAIVAWIEDGAPVPWVTGRSPIREALSSSGGKTPSTSV